MKGKEVEKEEENDAYKQDGVKYGGGTGRGTGIEREEGGGRGSA